MMKPKVKAIYTLYKHGRLTMEQVKASVPDVITKEEFSEITGQPFEEDT